MNKCLAAVFQATVLITVSLLLLPSAGHAYTGHTNYGKDFVGNVAPNQPEVQFTEEEQVWLDQHPVLRVATSPGWAPISFLGDDGNFHGIAVDFLKRMEPLLGVKFVFIEAHQS